ncbi:hypothetical protein [Cupriavidus sp. SK-4]|uniref:hypothetical protein n=1 Tax=Cupriavidus sp. SK-4 TaxID=574750 RepID=UPI0013789AFD|nr:hypothetical protein [Cupriavidus sp. SK-4]
MDRAGAKPALLVRMDALVFALEHRVIADQVGGVRHRLQAGRAGGERIVAAGRTQRGLAGNIRRLRTGSQQKTERNARGQTARKPCHPVAP